MASESYAQWKKRHGWDTSIFPDDVQRRVYGWAQNHPGAPDDSVLDELVKTSERLHPSPDYSFGEKVQQALSPPNQFGHTGGTADGKPAQAPSGQTATEAAKPDAAGVNTGIASLDEKLRAAGLGGTTAGTVTLWPSLGVDPQATVLGAVPGENTMNKLGQLQHGQTTLASKTADEWLKGLYKMGPQQLGDLQRRLWEQGWYAGTKVTDPSMIQFGRPDAATLAAYAEVLGEAARYNAADQRIGIDGVIGMGSPIKGQAAANGQPYETTNPADLRAALKAQAQQSLGRDPTDDEISQYQHQYLGQEDAARREIIAAGAANRTEGVTGPPSPSAGADQFIDSHNALDKIAYGTIARQVAFYDLLKSPV